MITVMKSTENGLQTLQEPVEGCWIHLLDPSPTEISRLSADYAVPEDFLTYPLDIDESARTENDHGATLIGLRVPVFQGEHNAIPYSTVPLGIVITEHVIFTVCKVNLNIISEFGVGRTRHLSTGKRNRFVLILLLAIANKFLHYLREINRQVDTLEDRLQKSLRNKEVLELLKYQKSLTLFTTALKSSELVLGRLQKARLFQKYEEDSELLDDALMEFGQAIEMTNISSSILSQMMDAFASIISNNLNVVMKFLASITIILALPTLVASIYGMNIGLPFQEMENAFILVMGTTIVFTIVVVYIFLKRDWL